MTSTKPSQESRRSFLKGSVSIGALSLLSLSPAIALAKKIASKKETGIYFGGGRYKETVDGELKFLLSRVTTFQDGSSEIKTIPSPIFPHGFAIDPKNNHRLIAFTKIGPKAAVYDTASWEAVKMLTANPGRLFYGHGVFSKNGKLLYATETDITNSKGFISIRDADTLKYLGDFPSYGSHPHDCKLIDGGRTLVVTNGGGDLDSGDLANLSYIDINTKKLIKQHKINDGRFNAGHVELDNEGDALVVSAPRRGLTETSLGAIHISKSKSSSLSRIDKPETVTNKMTGEALSARIIPEYNLLLVTHPTPGMVTCWHLNTLKCLKVISLPHARGVELSSDKKEFVVSYGETVAIKRYKTRTLEEVKDGTIHNTGISGSHIINWQTFQKG